MSQHTPGPWQISGPSSGKGSNDDGGDYAIFIRDELPTGVGGDVQILAEVIYQTDTSIYQPVEANARLMAQSPNLLSALVLLLSDCEQGADPFDPRCKTGSVDKARAAIKAAT